MNNDERMSVSVPITGIDTSTPDAIVADGKCEKLHNLRFSGGSWRNVGESPIEMDITSNSSTVRLVYHHPAAGDDTYIAIDSDNGNYVALRSDYLPDVFYVEPTTESGPVEGYYRDGEEFVLAEGVSINYDAGSSTYSTIVETPTTGLGLFERTINSRTFQYLTLGSVPSVGNPIYRIGGSSITEDGIITAVTEIYDGEFAITINNSTEWEIVFIEETEAVLPIKIVLHEYLPLRIQVVKKNNGVLEFVQNIWDGDFVAEPKFKHLGTVLIVIGDSRINNLFFVYKDGRYYAYDTSGVRISTDVSVRRICPNLSSNVVYEGAGGTFRVHDPIKSDKGDYLWAESESKYDAWRGEIGMFCALRSADGTILYTTPIQIINTAEDINGQFRLLNSDSLSPETAFAEPIVGRRSFAVNVGGEDDTIYLNTRYSNDFANNDDSWIDGIKSADWTNLSTDNKMGKNLLGALERLFPHHTMCNVDLTISVSGISDNHMIDNIAIYCTRIHQFFGNAAHSESVSGAKLDYETYVSSDNLFEEPYYLMYTKALSNAKKVGIDKVFEITLKHSTLQQSGLLYEPTQNVSAVAFEDCIEYNGRLHVYGITYTPPLPDREVFKFGDAGAQNPLTECCVEYKRNDIVYRKFFSAGDINIAAAGHSRTFALKQKICITTPISNAFYVKFGYPASDSRYMDSAYEYPMSYSNVLAVSYCIGDARADKYVTADDKIYATYNSIRKYKALSNNLDTPNRVLRSTDISREPNRIQASELNNPFAYPYSASYRVGSSENQILAVNSAAIEMSDAKFGEMPLYAFTDEGVFAFQSGEGSILYSAIIPINYDKIINPNTLAINYNLIYITAEGVKAISSNQTTLISEAINNAENKPPLDYLREAELHNLKAYNELAIHNPGSDYAFIYALNGGYWSTRDFKGVSIGADKLYQLVGDTRHCIFDLSKRESGEAVKATLKTRPIKFGSHEFKRLETFIPRLRSADNVELSIRFYGSNDRVNWALMREVKTEVDVDLVIRRFPFSARYIYIEMDIEPINVSAGFDISSMDMEYYLKFVRRLR